MKIVIIDTLDPDNVLMALWVLKSFPDSAVAIVLSARPVSFKAARYRDSFGRLCSAIGGDVYKMINPLTEITLSDAEQTWLKGLKKDDRAWFYASPDLSDPTVREDTTLYMKVTALRMAGFWKAHGIKPDRCRIYWDEESLTDGKITVGMAHSFHVHDWSFDFNQDESERYNDALRSISENKGNVLTPFSNSYRQQNRDVCSAYVDRVVQDLELAASGDILCNLYDLIAENMTAGVVAAVYVGGPFVDALTYIRYVPVIEVVGMGGNLKTGSTLFRNQFNYHVALDSANEFLACVVANSIKLTLLPTEYVKGSVFALSRAELFTVFEKS